MCFLFLMIFHHEVRCSLCPINSMQRQAAIWDCDEESLCIFCFHHFARKKSIAWKFSVFKTENMNKTAWHMAKQLQKRFDSDFFPIFFLYFFCPPFFCLPNPLSHLPRLTISKKWLTFSILPNKCFFCQFSQMHVFFENYRQACVLLSMMLVNWECPCPMSYWLFSMLTFRSHRSSKDPTQLFSCCIQVCRWIVHSLCRVLSASLKRLFLLLCSFFWIPILRFVYVFHKWCLVQQFMLSEK